MLMPVVSLFRTGPTWALGVMGNRQVRISDQELGFWSVEGESLSEEKPRSVFEL